MNTITRYILKDYVATLVMTILVFTFVMCVGTVIKAIDLVARGVSFGIILQVFLANIPFILSFTIPMSSLTTVLLIFSRLSLDGEITAMKASGITMWQIISGPILMSILLSGLCVYLNSWAAPNSHFANRKILRSVGVEQPINLLEEGRFVRDFPNVMIYVGSKSDNKLGDIVVYELGDKGVKRNIRAKSGDIITDNTNHIIYVEMYDVRIDQPSEDAPMDLSKSKTVNARKYPVRLDFSQLMDDDRITKKVPDMTMPELINAVKNVRQAYPDLNEKDLLIQRMKLVVSANERLALSLACFSFTILGIPLGFKNKRKESSIGIGVSLLIVFLFYLFIIIADSLVRSPHLHPDMIIWIPVMISEIAGLLLIKRAN
ncbi:MAG: YjgP/YjgQ family permease [Spartobacteria bacterium]|nr:YjgP/YjgQ family permease [Spartobacteria bacterium]